MSVAFIYLPGGGALLLLTRDTTGSQRGALYISTALQRSTLYILYIHPPSASRIKQRARAAALSTLRRRRRIRCVNRHSGSTSASNNCGPQRRRSTGARALCRGSRAALLLLPTREEVCRYVVACWAKMIRRHTIHVIKITVNECGEGGFRFSSDFLFSPPPPPCRTSGVPLVMRVPLLHQSLL